MRRLLAKTLVGLALAAGIGLAGLYWYMRQSLPVFTGTVRVSGLSADIDIVRDADAIPHILAVNKPDALFGLGYVHAQDRLWQMEFQRRIGHGRLSEIFGKAALPQDRFLRTVGFGRAARSAWQRLPAGRPPRCRCLRCRRERVHRRPPRPHAAAGILIAALRARVWTGPDVLVWVKMMAWDLSANYSSELLKHDLLARVGPDRTSQLLPPYPDDGLNISERRRATRRWRPRPRSQNRRATPRTAPAARLVGERVCRDAVRRTGVPCATCCSAAPGPKRSARTTGWLTAR